MNLYMNKKNMKHSMSAILNLLGMIFILSFFILMDSSIVHADNGETIVHVTRRGTHYHSEGCYHLQSDREITLYEAV